ncbi:hypothetical protein B0H16DRAFT_1479303 [Mycena metata]|uniref:Uncharacterized protein n=1 Tax=Mycena metata TaxID=1033252 RepID=A0AAD7MDN2_9AGAR|nr:hypothetical protein B0H16DRAFT_1479303 [Mycena metata]
MLDRHMAASFDRILSDAVTSRSTPALFFGVTTADGPSYVHQESTKVDDPTGQNRYSRREYTSNSVVVTQHDEAGRPSATVPAKGNITFGHAQLLTKSQQWTRLQSRRNYTLRWVDML